jgi:hypothetical protein
VPLAKSCISYTISITTNKQEHSFFSVKENAWHVLGQIEQDYPTSREAFQFAGRDFTVEKAPNIHCLPDGKEVVPKASFFTDRYRSRARRQAGR